MLDTLRFQNFKSWRDTGEIRLAPITGFFGTNSSGKSSILQLLLMLKQTVESNDQQQILDPGNDNTYVDLGTIYEILNQQVSHKSQTLDFELSWHLSEHNSELILPTRVTNPLFDIDDLILPAVGDPIDGMQFEASISINLDRVSSRRFSYRYKSIEQWNQVGLILKSADNSSSNSYGLLHSGVPDRLAQGKRDGLPAPIKFYGFPGEARLRFQVGEFLQTLSLALEKVFKQTHYLGPLREFPKRSYVWSGKRPQDVGRQGEWAVAALLAAKKNDPDVEIKVAGWLKALGLVADFSVEPIAPHRRDYEVRIRSRANSQQSVLLTDVGFGVSQILPVLVLCYYAPPGSTVILEQPEIHLHPSVQAGLADIFVEVARERNLQIIVESHSEHLLRRLQRRIAEGETIDHEQAALYFCDMDDTGTSHLTPLALDEFGNINNWPPHFFGDEMGDLVAMSEAALNAKWQIKIQL
jgi:predicted ATPase